MNVIYLAKPKKPELINNRKEGKPRREAMCWPCDFLQLLLGPLYTISDPYRNQREAEKNLRLQVVQDAQGSTASGGTAGVGAPCLALKSPCLYRTTCVIVIISQCSQHLLLKFQTSL
jgi:hypothetical protein